MTDRNPDMDDEISADRIPDLIKIGEIPSSYAQTLTTDIIEPVTISNDRCRFTLERVSGFLHSNSKISLGIIPQTNARAFYPLSIGVSNLLKTATLSIGGSVVCSVSDYSHFHSYQSLFISNENNKEREQYLSQRCMSHGSVYDSDLTLARVGVDTPNSAKTVGLDLGRNPVVSATDTQEMQLLPFQLNDATSAQTIADAPLYSVYLSDLFPFLRENQIPAQLINQQIHIDLVFEDGLSSISGTSRARRVCIDGGAGGGNPAINYKINTEEVRLIYDSISYDGEIMRQYAEQNPVLSFDYVDYRLAKRTGDQAEFKNLIFPIGGNGRIVSKVMFAIAPNGTATPASLLNNICARGAQQNTAHTTRDGKLAVNLIYNDLFEFNVDRSNSALLFHTTQQAEGAVPMIVADEWQKRGLKTTDVQGLTAAKMEGHTQNSGADGLESAFQWIAIRPNKGQRVNNKGMDLHYKSAGLNAETYTLRVYLELAKTATIQNGEFSCYFS
tara:strand:+ start:694 stop:2193 length:1500 start_codon:yes stop_codon:yes gene_type:complete